MVINLVNKSEFARRVGVSQAAISKACRPGKELEGALVGKKINVGHPLAIAYAEKQQLPTGTQDNGLDARYEEALAHCEETGRWSINSIHKNMKGVGYERAKRMFETMKASGIVPDPGDPPAPKQSAPPTQPSTNIVVSPPRAVSGQKKLKQDRMLTEAEIKQELFDSLPDDIRKLGSMTIRECVLTFGYFSNLEALMKSLKMMEDIHEKRIKNATAAGELVARDLIHRGVIDPIDTAHNRMLTDGSKTLGKRLYDKIRAGSVDERGAAKLIRDELTRILGPAKKRVSGVLRNIGEAS